ncbi:MAG: SusC/RagA family TonB-linked outer membrane protein [Bacteroidales bacterium]|nr:SusC/RagA family TonB-linked outer membrane protein [Bacteroidales bacterium]
MNKTIKSALLLIIIAMFSNLAYAQTKITGKVVDETNSPLPGVNIIQTGTSNGTITDLEGNYTITASADGTLEFSFMGYETQNVSINGQTTINISMEPSSEILDDVVVVGYGTQKRSDITGAVASVNSEALKERPITNIEEALTGQVTGLQISSTGGQPGAATKMNIRGITSMSGSSQPLVVVDGFPLSEVNTSAGGAGGEAFGVQIGAMSYINPDDIESIEVLKDASATAIYGNRGANGVIMITTKKGMKGSSGITYSAYYGIQEMKKRIDVMHFRDWVGYHVLRNSTSELFVDPDGNPYIFDDPEAMNINWQDEIYRRGIIQNHSLSMQGKAEKTSYTLSASYNQNQSILVETDFKKFTSRMSVDHQFSDKILVGSNLSFSNVNYNGTITDGREGTAAGLVIQALEANPYRLDQNTAARFRRAGVPGNVVENYLSNYYGGPDEIAKNVDLDKSINRFISNFYFNGTSFLKPLKKSM